MRIHIGRSELIALPAHFMHAEGTQFFDPTSGILFSGDLGAAAAQHVPRHPCRACSRCPTAWRRLHRRYMVSNKILRSRRWWPRCPFA